MDAEGLEDLMLLVRGFYRGGHATEWQAAFLDDLARSLDDLAIDARKWVGVITGPLPALLRHRSCPALSQ